MSEEVPLFAPGNIVIDSITELYQEYGSNKATDYSIKFSTCSEFSAYFNHVSGLSTDLDQAFHAASPRCGDTYSTGGGSFTSCEARLGISIPAGTEIGTAAGENTLSVALDLGARDSRSTVASFANDSRWRSDQYNVVCPLDYFAEDVKKQLYDKIEHAESSYPGCGTIYQDVAGRAQGVWFSRKGGPTHPEDAHLALVNDNVNAFKQVFSVGTSGPVSTGEYHFEPVEISPVNRMFDSTQLNEAYCYEVTDRFGGDVDHTILIEMPADDELRLANRSAETCGEGPWEMLDYKTYVR